jgi:hypothetical protein
MAKFSPALREQSAGTVCPRRDDDRSKPFNDWWNGKYMLGG